MCLFVLIPAKCFQENKQKINIAHFVLHLVLVSYSSSWQIFQPVELYFPLLSFCMPSFKNVFWDRPILTEETQRKDWQLPWASACACLPSTRFTFTFPYLWNTQSINSTFFLPRFGERNRPPFFTPRIAGEPKWVCCCCFAHSQLIKWLGFLSSLILICFLRSIANWRQTVTTM